MRLLIRHDAIFLPPQPKPGRHAKPLTQSFGQTLPGYTLILDQNFDGMALASPVKKADFGAAIGDSSAFANDATFAAQSIVTSPDGVGRLIRHKFPAGGYSTGSGVGIAAFPKPAVLLKAAATDVILEYDLRFEPGSGSPSVGNCPALAAPMGRSVTAPPPAATA
ncbi:hypothetical protein [Branchiibius hedensis]|uniref:hypothetical protein n=1 Tax=Branchiibius hedensis TaxID=672460 RepID=UPI0011B1F927